MMQSHMKLSELPSGGISDAVPEMFETRTTELH